MSDPGYEFLEAPGETDDSPALFLFHGTGGSEDQFFALGTELMPGARRIAPRGDVSEAGAARYFRRLAEGKYDMVDLGRATRKMADFVNDRLGASPRVLTAGFGYSNGANILAALLFEAPGHFDRAVLLHPLIPFVPAPQPGLAGRRVLITAGRNDPICPAAETQRLADWFSAQGVDVALHWHDGGHEIRRDEVLAAQVFLGNG